MRKSSNVALETKVHDAKKSQVAKPGFYLLDSALIVCQKCLENWQKKIVPTKEIKQCE